MSNILHLLHRRLFSYIFSPLKVYNNKFYLERETKLLFKFMQSVYVCDSMCAGSPKFRGKNIHSTGTSKLGWESGLKVAHTHTHTHTNTPTHPTPYTYTHTQTHKHPHTSTPHTRNTLSNIKVLH